MSLPTPSDLQTLDYVYLGQPFCNVPAKSEVVLSGMDYVYQAQPFVSNEWGETPSGWSHKIMGMSNISSIIGISKSSISKVNNV